jgi:hypothetical protein
MNGKALLWPERIVATLWRQLCRSLLHNLHLQIHRGLLAMSTALIQVEHPDAEPSFALTPAQASGSALGYRAHHSMFLNE